VWGQRAASDSDFPPAPDRPLRFLLASRKKDRYCFHNISPRNSISRLGRLSFLDHISIPCLVYLQPVLGLHVGIGPSSAVSGVATTPYTQAKPTIRTTILTARFMDCFSLSADPLGAGTLTRTNYTAICQETAHSGNPAQGEDRISKDAGRNPLPSLEMARRDRLTLRFYRKR
jgi:hypothetical protein